MVKLKRVRTRCEAWERREERGGSAGAEITTPHR
jgi:hypothetical protein